MKKLLLIIPIWLFTLTLNAQVFNTSSTLGRGDFSAGFELGIHTDPSDFSLFLHGGIGITSGADLGIKLGVLNGNTYFGGDVEFALGKRFSLSAGAHSWNNFGLDGTALFTFPIVNNARLFTGFDMDILFPTDDDVQIPLWIPLGIEIGIKSNMAFIFEVEISLTDVGSHYIGGGLNFYF